MKNKFLKCIIGILLGSFLATAVTPAVSVQAVTASEESVEGMKLATENDDIAMYYDKETAQIAFLYKDSGRVIETKILDGTGNATYQDYMKSELILSYYKNYKTNGETILTTNKLAIEVALNEAGEEQTIYTVLDDGLRVDFILRENKLSMDVVPKVIPEEKWRTKIWPYLSEEERDFVEKQYTYHSKDGGYRRNSDDSNTTLRQTAIEMLQKYIFQGEYTEEDMEEDNAAIGYVSTWENLEVRMSIIYTLDGDEIVVTVPTSDITVNDEDVILSQLQVLRYMTSATEEQTGYFVVPDGIGAVINFNNGLTKASDYVSRVYGKDTLIDATTYSSLKYYANMPMYGTVYDDYALLSVVEKGDTIAQLTTQVAGKVDSYNKAYWNFILTEKENVSTSSDASVSVNKYTDTYTDDIVIRYMMLEEENANYTGIAKAYQKYLIDKGELTKTERKEDASLYLEVLGAVKESKNFLGIPYQGISALTTFSEMKQMLEYFKISGVKDIEAELVGWMNNGDNHSALLDIDIDSSMGSKTELGRITDFAHEYEFGFYAALNLQTVYAAENPLSLWSTENFASKYASKFLSNEYAQLGTSKLGLDSLKINDYSGYLVSPAKLKTYTSKVLKELSKFALEGISLKDIGSYLVADYSDKNRTSRQDATDIENEAIGMVADEYNILLSNPDSYAWQYADAISDIPSRSNEYTVFAYDVPLLPLILDGCVSYSTTALNYDTQKTLSEMILKCVETRMNPKFYLMYSDMSALENTDEHYDELSISYMTWRKDIVSLYEEYNEFYELVQDADFAKHETLDKSGKIVKVTYTNGVKVYVNYSKSAYEADGHEIGASSYLIVEAE